MAIWLDAPHADLIRRLEDHVASWSAPPCDCCGGSGELHYLEHPPDPQTRVDYRCPRCLGDGVEPC